MVCLLQSFTDAIQHDDSKEQQTELNDEQIKWQKAEKHEVQVLDPYFDCSQIRAQHQASWEPKMGVLLKLMKIAKMLVKIVSFLKFPIQ